ncbi:hypothetical protein B0T24DRAFT_640591 [Lasiosphaeria ovina]|uniref:Uncharacterized protein n=1 Tax=Lasiosphaeria ovina TaxID=92902 RepID=A0AAE0MYR2_9PEZI|nr:hypothetical protein B0T24DRAFT_640591 [Lasiosphaeria ovina]
MPKSTRLWSLELLGIYIILFTSQQAILLLAATGTCSRRSAPALPFETATRIQFLAPGVQGIEHWRFAPRLLCPALQPPSSSPIRPILARGPRCIA